MRAADPVPGGQAQARRARPAAAVAALLALSSCGGGGGRAASAPTTVAAPVATTTTSAPPTTVAATTTVAPTTTTTVDPGSLPQTSTLPSAADPQFVARISDLVQAVASGRTSLAGPAFFPLGAYIQVKGISDPVHDYQTRLITDFDQDILALHSEIDPSGAPASLQSVSVPEEAEWIRPGVEYNKGSYWRVYDGRVDLLVAGASHWFTITSLISWRGEWYVVHLSSIR